MKIITTVGISLVSNSSEDCESLSKQTFLASLFEPANEYFKKYIAPKEEALLKSIKDRNASAEISSLYKIDPNEQAEIYLICTETVLSKLCGNVLKKHYGERVKEVKVISGLQIQDKKKFETEGLVYLFDEIERISQGYWQDVAINMTGGYKAIIPFLTVISQIYKVPAYYMFDDKEQSGYELLKMPQIPIDINWSEFEKYKGVWEDLRKGISNWTEYQAKNQLMDDFHACVWMDESSPDFALISGLGEAFYRRYQQWTFIYVLQNGPFSTIQIRRRALNDAINGLQEKVNHFILSNNLKNKPLDEITIAIRQQGGELDHTEAMKGTNGFISKYPSANPEIRLLYSFEMDFGKVSKLKIWDFRIESFNHSTYPKEFREFYEANKEGKWIPYLQTQNF